MPKTYDGGNKDLECFIAYVYAVPFYVACVLPLAIAVVLTAARFYARIFSGQGIAIDDWLATIALLFCWASAGTLICGLNSGVIGLSPVPQTSPAGSDELLQIITVFYILNVFAAGFIKVSVLFYWRRVFFVMSKPWSVVLWTLITLSAIWTIGIFLPLAIGTPASGKFSYFAALTASDLVTDILVFFFPIPLIWRLHMAACKKIETSLIFLMGSMSLVAAAVRFSTQTTLLERFESGQLQLDLCDDGGLYWSMVEIGIAIVAINIPALGHFIDAGFSDMVSAIGVLARVFSFQSLRSPTHGRDQTANQTTRTTHTRPNTAERRDSVIDIPGIRRLESHRETLGRTTEPYG